MYKEAIENNDFISADDIKEKIKETSHKEPENISKKHEVLAPSRPPWLCCDIYTTESNPFYLHLLQPPLAVVLTPEDELLCSGLQDTKQK